MLDTPHSTHVKLQPKLQRSHGDAMVAFHHAHGATRLADLAQKGSAKVLLPRVAGPVPEVVLLNTSGGLTGGDQLNFTMAIGAGCRVLATTQTAERGYAAGGVPARVTIKATLGAGARLDWMPQETILFQASNLVRDTQIDLGPSAECLLAESLVLGRHAMGETLHHATLHDRRMIRRGGRPVWAENFALTDGVLADRSGALLAHGAGALAVVCLVAQGAEDAVAPVRAVLSADAAASGWDGRCLVRIAARDGYAMRRQLAQVLQVLTRAALPRVWQMEGTI